MKLTMSLRLVNVAPEVTKTICDIQYFLNAGFNKKPTCFSKKIYVALVLAFAIAIPGFLFLQTKLHLMSLFHHRLTGDFYYLIDNTLNDQRIA